MNKYTLKFNNPIYEDLYTKHVNKFYLKLWRYLIILFLILYTFSLVSILIFSEEIKWTAIIMILII